MKVLAIFLDMLRANGLNVYNQNNQQRSLDDWFYNFGGTVYRNCFTPAPDTTRSSACLWSGRYPKKMVVIYD